MKSTLTSGLIAVVLGSCNIISDIKSTSSYSGPSPRPQCYEMRFGHVRPATVPPRGFDWCPALTTYSGAPVVTDEGNNVGYCLCMRKE